jgi:hypothetical protein
MYQSGAGAPRFVTEHDRYESLEKLFGRDMDRPDPRPFARPTLRIAVSRLEAKSPFFGSTRSTLPAPVVGPQVAWPLTSSVAIDGAFTWFPGAHDLRANLLKGQERILGLAGLRAVIIRGDAGWHFVNGRFESDGEFFRGIIDDAIFR